MLLCAVLKVEGKQIERAERCFGDIDIRDFSRIPADVSLIRRIPADVSISGVLGGVCTCFLELKYEIDIIKHRVIINYYHMLSSNRIAICCPVRGAAFAAQSASKCR